MYILCVFGYTNADMYIQPLITHLWQPNTLLFLKNVLKYSESEIEVSQSCLTLCDPMDCSPPGSSVHGISQARIPEWVAISFSRGFSRPQDQTRVSRIAGRRFTEV